MQYLTASAFDSDQNQDSVRSTALTGFYGVQDYVFAYWDYHLDQISSRRGDNSESTGTILSQRLNTSWRQFLERYTPEDDDAVGDSYGHVMPPVSSPSALATLERIDNIAPDMAIQCQGWKATDRSKTLEKTITFVRKALQSIDQETLSEQQRQTYLFNGPTKFKCPRRICHWFETGFNDQGSLMQHLLHHEMSFRCPHEGCYAQESGFPSSSTLQNHVQNVHPSELEEEILFHSQSGKSQESLPEACTRGDMATVKILLQGGADIHQGVAGSGNRNGLTPIVMAARYGHIAICQYLMEIGGNAYEAANKAHPCLTAVGESIKHEDRDLFFALVAGTDVSKRTDFINSKVIVDHFLLALDITEGCFLATMLRWYELEGIQIPFERILSGFVRQHSTNLATQDRLQGMLEIFSKPRHDHYRTSKSDSLSSSEDPSAYERWLRHILLQEKVKSNNLFSACRRHNELAVRFLLKNLDREVVANLEVQGTRILDYVLADYNCSAKVVRILLDHGVFVDTQGRSGSYPIHTACRSQKSTEIFTLVLGSCQKSVNEVDRYGDTPLLLLANRCSSESYARMKMLCDTGEVDLTKRDQYGRTAFAHAILHYSEYARSMMELLYSLHPGLAMLKDGTGNGLSPLQYAIKSCNLTAIEYLLTLSEAGVLMDMCRPLESYEASQLRALLFGALAARRYAVAKELLFLHELRLNSDRTGDNERLENCPDFEDPDILPLLHLRGYKAYDELTSRDLSKIREALDRTLNVEGLKLNRNILRRDLETLVLVAKHGTTELSAFRRQLSGSFQEMEKEGPVLVPDEENEYNAQSRQPRPAENSKSAEPPIGTLNVNGNEDSGLNEMHDDGDCNPSSEIDWSLWVDDF